MWASLKGLLCDGRLTIPHKVSSHLPIEAVGDSISWHEYILNGIADALAEKAVADFVVPRTICSQVEDVVSLSFLGLHEDRCCGEGVC